MMDQNPLTMYGGTCSQDGSELKFVRCDKKAVYFECECCEHKDRYVFANEEEATFYCEEAKSKIIGRLHLGLISWQETDWKRLRNDIVRFTNQYPMYRQDIQIQMAHIACMTLGYNMIDRDTYRQCKTMFCIAEKEYKTRLRLLKLQLQDGNLPKDIREYWELRQNYIRLRSEYRKTKKIINLLWNILKFVRALVLK